MQKIYLAVLCFLLHFSADAQQQLQITKKATLGWNRNIETYFIAEKLAVQYIGNYVFSQKDSLYRHQPIVYEAHEHFQQYVNTPCIKRVAELMRYFRDTYHDNAEILEYMLFLRPFPESGERFEFRDSAVFHPNEHPHSMTNLRELADSLRAFYVFAGVKDFLRQHHAYYEGALREARKDLHPENFSAMERFYGENFAQYAMFIMPLMPITYGEDNYRAFGPIMHWPQGKVAGMVFSSSRMIPYAPKGKAKAFGFDNPHVTRFLTVHEISHSFVNPHVDSLAPLVARDTALFTESLRLALEPSYIGNWRNCVIEHLVRLGEIRVAESMHDSTEANHLRRLHIHDFKFVLIPLLEKKIMEYEANRKLYPNFASFLPELFDTLHRLTPNEVDALVAHAGDNN